MEKPLFLITASKRFLYLLTRFLHVSTFWPIPPLQRSPGSWCWAASLPSLVSSTPSTDSQLGSSLDSGLATPRHWDPGKLLNALAYSIGISLVIVPELPFKDETGGHFMLILPLTMLWWQRGSRDGWTSVSINKFGWSVNIRSMHDLLFPMKWVGSDTNGVSGVSGQAAQPVPLA